MIQLISALLIAGSTPVTNQAAPDSVALRVRAYADKQVDKATIRPWLEVADDLLGSAGLVVAWRVCDRPESCPVEDTPVPEIVVILSSRDWQNGRENCGLAAKGARDSAGTVMVSVPCVAGAAFRLTRRPGTSTHPLLAMPRHDDLIGAIVAHEIGHLLGIRHAPAGLMRASLETDEIIALRRGKLRFSPAEAGRMRLAALLAGEERLRSSAAGSPPDPPRPMRMLEDEKRGLFANRGGVATARRGTRSGVEIEHDDRRVVTQVELRTNDVIGVQPIFQGSLRENKMAPFLPFSCSILVGCSATVTVVPDQPDAVAKIRNSVH